MWRAKCQSTHRRGRASSLQDVRVRRQRPEAATCGPQLETGPHGSLEGGAGRVNQYQVGHHIGRPRRIVPKQGRRAAFDHARARARFPQAVGRRSQCPRCGLQADEAARSATSASARGSSRTSRACAFMAGGSGTVTLGSLSSSRTIALTVARPSDPLNWGSTLPMTAPSVASAGRQLRRLHGRANRFGRHRRPGGPDRGSPLRPLSLSARSFRAPRSKCFDRTRAAA